MSKDASSVAQEKQPVVFLLYGPLRTGGIETLIVRLANHYADRNFNVVLFCGDGGTLLPLIRKSVTVTTYNRTSELIVASRKIARDIQINSTILMVTFDPISAARGLALDVALRKKLKIKHVSGVFHPRAYFMSGERRDRVLLNYLVARAIGLDNLFFMNEECRSTHSARWKRNLSSSPILSLPISYQERKWVCRRSETLHVVSVGRLVNFKSYNLGIAKIVSECRERGVHLRWAIYGEGPLEDQMRHEISRLGVQDKIVFFGSLSYEMYSETISKYDIFVGMGTAALEASMLGVPTICATVDEPSSSYGYIYELPFGNVGEKIYGRPTNPIGDLVARYNLMPDSQRESVSDLCREYSKRYGIPEFVNSLESLKENYSGHNFQGRKYMVSLLYIFMTEGPIARGVRKLIGWLGKTEIDRRSDVSVLQPQKKQERFTGGEEK